MGYAVKQSESITNGMAYKSKSISGYVTNEGKDTANDVPYKDKDITNYVACIDHTSHYAMEDKRYDRLDTMQSSLGTMYDVFVEMRNTRG
jgi:hypothetical protein